ncbi:MAG: hypothetical protein HYS07_02425 [Chlamydiae bacterium]|nr:hypothetical protein [Chlamydiota bacterium]MBI3276695.1 hypothetical protein [Chlamydiota bacterium]
MEWIKEAVLIFLSVILQSQLKIFGYFDLFSLISFYFFMRRHWLSGVIFSLIGGFIWDGLSGESLGVKSMSLLGSFFVIKFLHSIFFQEHLLARLGGVALGMGVGFIFEWGLNRFEGNMRPFTLSILFKAVVQTGLLTVVIYPLLDRLFRGRHRWVNSV